MYFEELRELSDEEIRTKHKDKRTYMKAPRFALAYGSSAFTLSSNMNIPLEEAIKIEQLYKELHNGIFEWGKKVFDASIKQGYIETEDGFKLRLPEFDYYSALDKIIKEYSKEWWQMYREGKLEYKTYWESFEEKKKNKEIELYKIKNLEAFNHYKNHKQDISKYFQLKGQYFRLCLNAPIQTMAGFQTKLFTTLLFEYIEERNHYWKARISNIIHDEGLMEVEDSLVEEYKEKLAYFMKKGGNYYLQSPDLEMKADSGVADNWYEAK
jgi:DNA polymerase I-like protein with 3'-5' exonuclease and polymerase domains